MKKILKNIIKALPLLLVAMSANAVEQAAPLNQNRLCYSAYHLQQNLNLLVNFGDNIEQQKTKMDINLHVREIPITDNKYLQKKLTNEDKNLRSYVFLINPNSSKTNGIKMDIKSRYQHPFIVVVDGVSGELLNIHSTVDNADILNEYRSFYDIFQYSETVGKYRYQNANGWYQAAIEDNGEYLVKQNLGYLENNHNGTNLHIEKSYLTITRNKTENNCFYHKAKGEENFKSVLSLKAFVDGNTSFTVNADTNRALPASHYFYSLSSDLLTWPRLEDKTPVLSLTEAKQKTLVLMQHLSLTLEDDDLFLKTLKQEKNLWQYLSENIIEHGLSDELSKKLFWALDRIDTKESVSTLAKLVTSPLTARDHYRAVLALGSTNAAFDQNSVARLTNHLSHFINPEYSAPKNLTFVRMLGAMASQRNVTDPQHSADIRDFLYSQVGSFDNHVNAAVIDAIGNLKGAINAEGETILSNQLQHGSNTERLSAASAFKRIPFNADNNDVLLEQLTLENHHETKKVILDVLGKSSKSNNQIKQTLISVLGNNKLKQNALKSMKNIGYDYQRGDIKVLEENLRDEKNSVNQRLLATMILKHRREHTQ